MMAFCSSCGASIPEGSRFCTECGARQEAAPVIPDTPAPEPELPGSPATDVPMPEMPVTEPEAPFSQPAPVFSQPEAAQEAPFTQPAPAAPQQEPAPVFSEPDAAPALPYAPSVFRSYIPGKRSPYAPMTSWGMAVQIILMNLPVVGFILMVVWACGGCRKLARRNLARANLILLILAVIVIIIGGLLARFVFSDEITRVFELILPGYTLQWG